MSELPNLSYIKELSGDDTVFEQKFITILKEEFPIEKQTYLDLLIRSKNYKEAAELVHKLKHKFNILSMEKGYKLAVKHEEELLKKNEKFHSDFMSVLDQIETYLKTI